jgi:hypothetical protein
MSSIDLGAVLGEQRGQLLDKSDPVPAGDRAARDRGGGAAPPRAAEPRRGNEAPVLRLIDVEHALRDPRRVDVLRVDAAGARSARAVGGQRLRDLVRAGKGCSGEMWSPLALRPPRSVAPAATSSATSRRGWRDLDADAGHEPLPPRSGASCPRSSPSWPMRGTVRRRSERRCASTARGPRSRCRRLLAVVAAVGDVVLQDHLLQVARARRARGQASSAATRSSSLSPMPTRMPLVNGMRSSPAARIGPAAAPVLGRASPGGRRGRGLTLRASAPGSGDLAQPRRSPRLSTPRLCAGAAPLERPLAVPAT